MSRDYYIKYQLTTYIDDVLLPIDGTSYTYSMTAGSGGIAPSGYSTVKVNSGTFSDRINATPIYNTDKKLVLNVSFYSDSAYNTPIDVTNSTVISNLQSIALGGSTISVLGNVAEFSGGTVNTLQYLLYDNGSHFLSNQIVTFSSSKSTQQSSILNIIAPSAYYIKYQLSTYPTGYASALNGTNYIYTNPGSGPVGAYNIGPTNSITTISSLQLPPLSDNDQFTYLNMSFYWDTSFLLPIDVSNTTVSSPVMYNPTATSIVTFAKIDPLPFSTTSLTHVGMVTDGNVGGVVNTLQYKIGDNSSFKNSIFVTFVDSGAAAQVNNLNLIAPPPLALTCFLGDAKVLTFDGYKRIDSLQKGDLVKIPQGYSAIKDIKLYDVKSSEETNPYIIPAGKYGSLKELLISPQHCVKVGSEMIKAKDLGLEQKDMKSEFTYYNLELDKWYSMYVEGVEVETYATPTNVFLNIKEYEKVKDKCKGLDIKEFTNGFEVPLYQRY